jgi:hypothetical protein
MVRARHDPYLWVSVRDGSCRVTSRQLHRTIHETAGGSVLTPFIGYSIGRRYIGHVDCGGDRLVDLFNGGGSVVIRDAFVESFDDDTVSHVGDVTVDRSILYAIEMDDRRGDEARAIHAVDHRRIHVRLGPYSALGLLPEAADQLALPLFDPSGPMIRLSDATIGYEGGGVPHLRDVGSLVVNRELMDWVRAGDEDAPAFMGVPVVTDRN